MDNDEYLQAILKSQTLASDSEELKLLQKRREEVETLLREHFNESSPTIRYGGSKAKGTMIREAYDLDIISYFARDDTSVGETLEDIYANVRKILSAKYLVESKPSALRIKDLDQRNYGADFHIDIVPGRYTDDSKSDVFLYRASGDKKRLKTNLDIYIKHVKDSGFTDAIRLLKLWRIRNALRLKHFALELLTIKLLKGRQSAGLGRQLEHVLEQFRDNNEGLSIQDPANPTGNDLSELLNANIRTELQSASTRTLQIINDSGCKGVFGPVGEDNETSRARRIEILSRAAASVIISTKPWSYDS